MRKILSILAAVGLTSTAASAVVACGTKSSSEVGKETDIAKIPFIAALVKDGKLKIAGDANITVDSAYSAFTELKDVNAALKLAKLNKESFDLSIVGPTATSNALFKITVKDGGKYSGTISVIIDGYKVSLESAVTGASSDIQGTADMDASKALTAFLATDAGKKLDKDQIEVKTDSFKPAQPGTNGSVIIAAKSDSTKYTGELNVVITKLSKLSSETQKVSSTNDDHQTTVITLSTADALRLGYIKQDGDKFVAGDKLPNGPLTTKVGDSTITATFTPNFENGTVQVLLTIDTPTNN